jgi:CRISPR-associated endonuclease/helicase Cas3
MSFRLFSHPEMLLKDHLLQVTTSGMARYNRNQIFMEYAELQKVILAFHDLGKGSEYFQGYLLENAPRTNLSRHSEFSALLAYHYCEHELVSAPLNSLMAFVCVKSHHGNVEDFSEMLCTSLSNDDLLSISEKVNYNELNDILSELALKPILSVDFFKEALCELDKRSTVSHYRSAMRNIEPYHWLCLNYLFSTLIWADKYSAIFQQSICESIEPKWQISYLDKYKSHLPSGASTIAEIRNEAYISLVEGIKPELSTYTLNMPTGSGKTINALKVALELKRIRPELQRIIYSLPFTSIIDQNQRVFEDILLFNSLDISSDMILAHHHLAEYHYQSNNEYGTNESEYLVETWDSELVVTTFVQLLATCLSTKNSNLKRFHRLANAVIILDEVQNIPHHYWSLLGNTLNLIANCMNSVVVLVTATLPMIFHPEDSSVCELAVRKQVWFSSLNRIAIDVNHLRSVLDLQSLAQIIVNEHKCDNSLKRLVILNTIQSSLDLHKMLADLLPEVKLLYLSSNVIPKQRLDRIRLIKEHKSSGLIVVSTQVVEAGVDIDVDVVYRDLAPLDSIIQASGRCNRNETKACSRVVLFQLAKEQRPYWKYIYDETLVTATRKALETANNVIQESELHEIGKQYYRNLNQISSSDKSKRIATGLASLNLGTALNYHAKNNPQAFNLIDSFPTQTVYIALDTEASELLSKYYLLHKSSAIDKFDKKANLKAIVRKMGSYMINVSKNLINTQEPIFIIERDEVMLHYDIDTGFKRKPEQTDFIF